MAKFQDMITENQRSIHMQLDQHKMEMNKGKQVKAMGKDNKVQNTAPMDKSHVCNDKTSPQSVTSEVTIYTRAIPDGTGQNRDVNQTNGMESMIKVVGGNCGSSSSEEEMMADIDTSDEIDINKMDTNNVNEQAIINFTAANRPPPASVVIPVNRQVDQEHIQRPHNATVTSRQPVVDDQRPSTLSMNRHDRNQQQLTPEE